MSEIEKNMTLCLSKLTVKQYLPKKIKMSLEIS